MIKPITGYKGYEVSDDGVVYSTRNFNRYHCENNDRKELKQNTTKGYKTVTLCINQKRKTLKVHRIVYETFVGPVEGKQVHHKDKNRANNQLKNLDCLSPDDHISVHQEMEAIQLLQRLGYTVTKSRT